MSTERFEVSLVFALKWEGSAFTNDPKDRGGPTRFGVTQRVYDPFRQRQGLPLQSVEAISIDEVRAIYRRQYWDAVIGDELPVPVDMVLFDTGILMGPGRAVRFLQQSLGVGVDGAVGKQTRDALAGADGDKIAAKCLDLREARLRAIVEKDPTQARFLKGWLNRLNDLRRTVEPTDGFEHGSAMGIEEVLQPEEDAVMGRASLNVAEDFADAAGVEDPGAPEPGDPVAEASEDAASARDLANFGEPGQEAVAALPEPMELESAAAGAVSPQAVSPQAPRIPFDVNLAQAFLDACIDAAPRISYGLGAKVPSYGAAPGSDFKAVDCSGFVREAIWRATSPHLNFPDGSVVQHDWIRDHGFARATPDDALRQDGVVRIAFLRPQDSPKRIGHVVLIHNARTLESHGGVGPDSRPWTRADWQAKTLVYVLT